MRFLPGNVGMCPNCGTTVRFVGATVEVAQGENGHRG